MGRYIDMLAAKLQEDEDDVVDYAALDEAMQALSNDVDFVILTTNYNKTGCFDMQAAEACIIKAWRNTPSNVDMQSCCHAFIDMQDNIVAIEVQLTTLVQKLMAKYQDR